MFLKTTKTPKPDTSQEDVGESALSFMMLLEGLASLSQMSAELLGLAKREANVLQDEVQ